MKFYIRASKAHGRTTLYYQIQRRTPKIHLKLATPISVSIEDWNATDWDNTKSVNRFANKYSDVWEMMKLVEAAINLTIADGHTSRDEIMGAVNAVYYRNAINALDEYNAAMEAKRIKAEHAPIPYLVDKIERIRRGVLLQKNGRPYSINTERSYATLLTHLRRFEPFDWDDISKSLVDRFTSSLLSFGLMRKSINCALHSLRVIVGHAYNEGIHNNERALHCFSSLPIQEDEHKAEIYLNAEELEALYNMPLEGSLAQYRDMFLVGCYTCQRFSDYKRIDKTCFYTTAKGNKVVRLIQEKTGTSVTIPVLNDNLINIMERNNYQLPDIVTCTLIRNIKVILKRLANDVPSLAEPIRTTLSKQQAIAERNGNVTYQRDEHGRVVRPKYELVGTHTARRSGITNLYLTGKYNTRQMMSISGHKSADVFAHYIRVTADEMADAIVEATKIEDIKTANL